MEPMGLSAYELAKALNFPGIYDVVREAGPSSADAAIRLGKYFGPRSLGSIFKTITI
jgi:plasmid maintenance system antidote protein VapI